MGRGFFFFRRGREKSVEEGHFLVSLWTSFWREGGSEVEVLDFAFVCCICIVTIRLV